MSGIKSHIYVYKNQYVVQQNSNIDLLAWRYRIHFCNIIARCGPPHFILLACSICMIIISAMKIIGAVETEEDKSILHILKCARMALALPGPGPPPACMYGNTSQLECTLHYSPIIQKSEHRGSPATEVVNRSRRSNRWLATIIVTAMPTAPS